MNTDNNIINVTIDLMNEKIFEKEEKDMAALEKTTLQVETTEDKSSSEEPNIEENKHEEILRVEVEENKKQGNEHKGVRQRIDKKQIKVNEEKKKRM